MNNKSQGISEFLTETLLSDPQNDVNECVIVCKKIEVDDDESYVLAKNRDRAYKPTLSIVHTVVNNMEVVYLKDNETNWCEGMNAAGICIVNSALQVESDEDAEELLKAARTPSFTKDGEKIIKALTMNNVEDAVLFIKNFKGGVHGHNFICDGDTLAIIEKTKKHDPIVSYVDGLNTVVRTNIGIGHASAGYQDGIGKQSSEERKKTAEEALEDVEDTAGILKALRVRVHEKTSQLNPRRETDTMFTSSQMLLNPKTLTVTFNYFKKYVDEFKGVITDLPKGFESTIKIEINEL